MNKLLVECDVVKIDNINIVVSRLGKCGIRLNNTETGVLALNLFKVFCNADVASKSLSIVRKTLNTLKVPWQFIKLSFERKFTAGKLSL